MTLSRMTRSTQRFGRRNFVRAAGAATLFAPFMSLLDGRSSRAADQPGKCKYLLIFVTHGTNIGKWVSQGSDSSITSFSEMTQPLSAISESLILMEGVSGNGLCAGHGSPAGLCGYSWGANPLISIDQFISDGLADAGVSTPMPHLVLGDGTTEAKSMFYRDNQPLTPVASPEAAYKAIFGGVSPTSAPAGEPSAGPDPRLLRRQSTLDLLNDELTQLKQSLGAEERAKLDIHAESLRQIETRLAGQMGGSSNPVSCTAPSQPTNSGSILADTALLLPMAVNAFACDLTRVASVQFGHHQNCPVDVPGITGEWHNEFLHSPNKAAELVKLEVWLSEQFANAALQLQSLPAPDGNGTLYDQTLMVWARDMGDSVNHGDTNMVYVFAGGAGGYLKHSGAGRYLDAGGGAHMKVLTTCADAMGIDYQGFGPSGDKAPFSELIA